ncbi:serine hydrolase [Phenylobacterium sp.]|jgi:CubicO group peptidase (beta-lactamase class C family)|uniref:serine hydrolase n=1 Tax=Phenylobacterium sp. TaxID=1871053 RepID=UPI002F94EA70
MIRRVFVTAAGALLGAVGLKAKAQLATPWSVPADAEIRRILVERIDTQKSGVGIVVGVTGPTGRRLVSYGVRAPGDAASLDGRTVFEIGSMTKVFTSLLLAGMVRKGEVALDDPVAKYLPPDVKVPQRGGKQITLVDLATHTSGLPSVPPDFSPGDGDNPYADFTVEKLYAFLGAYELPRDIGALYAYSNIGAGLLGQALARRAGSDYDTLVKRRITGPLGMADTAIRLTPSMRSRLAAPFDGALQPAKNWDLPTIAGAGALRSTADDMLTFLEAAIGMKPSHLKPAFDDQLKVRRQASPNMDVALGWHVARSPRGEIVWHNGRTGGYRSFMAFNPATREGVVVLTNAATLRGGDDIGMHVLAGAPLAPAPPAPVARKVVPLTQAQAEALVGRYQLAPGVVVTVTREGSRVFAQLTGQGRAEIYPESPTRVFWKIVDAQASFELGPDGRAAQLTLHQNGRNTPAPRMP